MPATEGYQLWRDLGKGSHNYLYYCFTKFIGGHKIKSHASKYKLIDSENGGRSNMLSIEQSTRGGCVCIALIYQST